MSWQVRLTPEADAQIGTIDDGWRRNRAAAPDLFFNELAGAFEVIGHTPNLGRLYRRSPVPGTRRVLLKKSQYHVLYVAVAAEIRVLAVWHAERGVGPPLRIS